MGSFFSCIPPIEQYINKIIFDPPTRKPEDYTNFNTSYSMIFHFLTKSNKKISAINIKPRDNCFEPTKYLVFSNARGGDIIMMFDYFRNLANILNVGVIIYDYIGYGLSEPTTPSEKGCYESLEATMNFMLDNLEFNPENIFLVGYSLGTAVIVDYVSKNSWKTPIILISPFKTICRVVYDSWLFYPIDKFETLYKLKNISCPIQIIHGKKDNIVNIRHSIDIYNLVNDKSLAPFYVDDADHNDILYKIPEYIFWNVFDMAIEKWEIIEIY